MTYLHRCHANHRLICLIAWTAGTFQVSLAVAVWIAWSWFGVDIQLDRL